MPSARNNHILRYEDSGAVASASRYHHPGMALVAARRIAKRTGRVVVVMWCDDAGTPKTQTGRAEPPATA